MKIWGIENTYDSGRAIEIYEAIKGLDWSNLVEIACGYGVVSDSLKWVFPDKDIKQFDINEYPEWKNASNVKPYIQDVMEFIKEEKDYDVVLFLNSYRNWPTEDKDKFNTWILKHVKYFITSGENMQGNSIDIGRDSKNFRLKLYKITT